MQYVEIYNEQIKDLLQPEHGTLDVREAPGRGTHVAGAANVAVTSREDVEALLNWQPLPDHGEHQLQRGLLAQPRFVSESAASASSASWTPTPAWQARADRPRRLQSARARRARARTSAAAARRLQAPQRGCQHQPLAARPRQLHQRPRR